MLARPMARAGFGGLASAVWLTPGSSPRARMELRSAQLLENKDRLGLCKNPLVG